MTATKTTPAEFRCMACGVRTPVEIACEHEGAARVVSRCMASIGRVGTAMLSYLALHRPARQRLTWEKTERLLTELLDVYDAGAVVRDRVRHPLSDDVWLAALAAVRDAVPTLSLPLDGHGYLFAILASMSQKAQQLAEREQAARARGDTPVGYSAAHAPFVASTSGLRSETTDEARLSRREKSEELKAMPDHVKAALANFGKGPKTIAPAAAPTPAGINPREGAATRTPPAMAQIDGRKQLVEIINRKGQKVTVRLLEAAEGYENTTVINVKELL